MTAKSLPGKEGRKELLLIKVLWGAFFFFFHIYLFRFLLQLTTSAALAGFCSEVRAAALRSVSGQPSSHCFACRLLLL